MLTRRADTYADTYADTACVFLGTPHNTFLRYDKGEMMSGEVKAALIQTLQDIVQNHQDLRAKISDEEIKYFMSA